jgi:ATP-binding cassette, subfamily B, multidrug efflux pump
VKVFNHEDKALEAFKEYNYDLRDKQQKAQFFGGIMGPVVGNLGQLNYALTAMLGGILCVFKGFDVIIRIHVTLFPRRKTVGLIG